MSYPPPPANYLGKSRHALVGGGFLELKLEECIGVGQVGEVGSSMWVYRGSDLHSGLGEGYRSGSLPSKQPL